MGKTTLAKALSEKIGATYIHDIVREEAVPKGFSINENTPFEVQVWLVARQWELEKTTKGSWIADKSLFDFLIYGNIALADAKYVNVRNTIQEMIENNANYDFVFYLPIEIPFEADGIRSADREFQKEVDRRYKKYLDNRGIEYVTLTGSVQERVDKAVQHLSV